MCAISHSKLKEADKVGPLWREKTRLAWPSSVFKRSLAVIVHKGIHNHEEWFYAKPNV